MHSSNQVTRIKPNQQKKAFNSSNEALNSSLSRKQAKKLAKVSIKQERANKSFLRTNYDV